MIKIVFARMIIRLEGLEDVAVGWCARPVIHRFGGLNQYFSVYSMASIGNVKSWRGGVIYGSQEIRWLPRVSQGHGCMRWGVGWSSL